MRGDPRTVSCPLCGADAGSPCYVSGRALPSGKYHEARIRKAMKARGRR